MPANGPACLPIFQPGSGALRSICRTYLLMYMACATGVPYLSTSVSTHKYEGRLPQWNITITSTTPNATEITSESECLSETIKKHIRDELDICAVMRLLSAQSPIDLNSLLPHRIYDCDAWIDFITQSHINGTVKPRDESTAPRRLRGTNMSPITTLRKLWLYMLNHRMITGFVAFIAAMTLVGLTAGHAYESTQQFRTRMPPMWGPHMNREYSFRKYYKDVADWLVTTESPPSMLAFLVKRQLKGTALKLVERMTRTEMLVGGFGHDGVWRDPVPLILDTLRLRFGELDSGRRLVPMLKMMSFSRVPGELFTEFMVRFDMVREDAENEAGFFLSTEAYALIIIRNYPLDLEIHKVLQEVRLATTP